MSKELAKTYDPKGIEDRLYQKWLEKKYFHAEVDRSKKPFTIVIPPPNITGQLHMGHALDNTMQDILIRFKRMQGYNALWQPGTDHASIATEVKIIEKLKEEGINCDVINIHTIKPIDREAVLASAAKTGAVLTVENHNVIGGLYSAVAEVLGTSKIPVVGLGVNDRWGEVGKVPYLREVFGFTAENIMAKAKEAIAAK